MRTKKTLSRPEQIRKIFRKYPNKILTRREILEKITAHSWFHQDYNYSMALSRMVQNGEVESFNLLGKHGYRLIDKTFSKSGEKSMPWIIITPKLDGIRSINSKMVNSQS